MTVTIAHIAARAGVSKATVSRVLNRKPDVDPDTARRIMDLVDDLGYVPSASAQALANGRARCLGVLVPPDAGSWMFEVLRGFAAEIEPSGYTLTLQTMARGDVSLAGFAAQVSARAIDGLAVIVPPERLDYFARLRDEGLPVVLIDTRGDHPAFPSVTTTNVAGGFDATTHLLRQGRARVAMINGPALFGCSVDREAGYRRALEQAGLPVDAGLVVEAAFDEAGGAAALRRLLAAAPGITGLFAANDLMAIGAMAAIAATGRSVPDDIAVVGFDDIPAAAHTSPALTTVRQPLYEMGHAAALHLIDRLEGDARQPQSTTLPTSLVIRRSCGAVTLAPDLGQFVGSAVVTAR